MSIGYPEQDSGDERQGRAMSYQANMVKVYFGQREHYMSESKDTLVRIEEMPPRHAANAAEKLLREARFWAEEAGAPYRNHAHMWVARQPLFQALAKRAERS
jgi:hypothetical protein